MSGFSADWLALREPADVAARSQVLSEQLADALRLHAAQAGRARDVLRVLDLGAGTGANLRYLAPRLAHDQHWLLVDHDALLLARAVERTAAWPSDHSITIRAATRTLDLRAGVNDPGLFAGRDLVTASALIDLVSEAWLQDLAARCADHRAIVALALTYDGRIACTPEEPEDERVRELVNRHQRTDKGFGAATGPDAVEIAHACFTAVGDEVTCASSDWLLAPDSRELQRQLIDGWAEAATEIAPEESAAIASWRTRRHAHVDNGRSQIIVGHQDLLATPQLFK